MPHIVYEEEWDSQPQYPATLKSDVAHFVLPSIKRELKENLDLTNTGNVTFEPTLDCLGARCGSGETRLTATIKNNLLLGANNCGAIFANVIFKTCAATWYTISGETKQANVTLITNEGFRFVINGSSKLQVNLGYNDTSSTSIASSATTLLNTLYRLAAFYVFSGSSVTLKFYINGVLVGTSTASNYVYNSAWDTIVIGKDVTNTDDFIVTGYASRRKEPKDKEIEQIWSAFEPQISNIWVPSAGGGAVNADHIHALEWLANIGSSAAAPFEHSGSLAASAQPPFEFLSSAAADVQTPADWLSGIVRDAVAGIEYRCALVADSSAQIDYAALLRADDVALFEYEMTARADHVSPVAWLSALQADAVVQAEWTGGILVNADAALPIEWRGTVSADGLMPISIAQMLAVDQVIPAEFGAGVVRDQAAVLEWLTAIGADALLPLSTIALVRGDQAIMAEWGGTAAFVSGNINVFHIDARGTVWHLDARGTVWKITKH